MNCRVVVEAAVPVYDVGTPDEAVRIAISKTGEMLNPDLNYVEINMSERVAPGADHPAFIVADEALVALDLEMTVFNVDGEEHASRIARKEIGQRLENIPLKVVEVEVIAEDDGEEAEEEGDVGEEADVDEEEVDAGGDQADASGDRADVEPERRGSSDGSPAGDREPAGTATGGADGGDGEGSPAEDGASDDDDDDPLPEFEDLL